MGIKLSDYLVHMSTEDDNYRTPVIVHWCKACEETHQFACLGVPQLNGAIWTWDKDVLAPTMSPSMNIRVGPFPDGHEERCHYFLRRGMIEYLPDCTHELAGKTLPLQPLPESSILALTGLGPQPPEAG